MGGIDVSMVRVSVSNGTREGFHPCTLAAPKRCLSVNKLDSEPETVLESALFEQRTDREISIERRQLQLHYEAIGRAERAYNAECQDRSHDEAEVATKSVRLAALPIPRTPSPQAMHKTWL